VLFSQLQTCGATSTRASWSSIASRAARRLKGDPPRSLSSCPTRHAKDYEQILLILLARLEEDQQKLARSRAHILTVGLSRARRNAGSGSLVDELRKVLLAVVEDGKSPPEVLAFPRATTSAADARERRGGSATRSSRPEFIRWVKDEKEKRLRRGSASSSVLDMMTGLKTSVVYRTAINIWRREGLPRLREDPRRAHSRTAARW